MIIFGYPIHRKYLKKIFKIIMIFFITIILLAMLSCSKIQFDNFDPTTTTLRYLITKEDKWKQ